MGFPHLSYEKHLEELVLCNRERCTLESFANFCVKSCLEKTRLLITVAGCKKYRFFLKKFEINKQNCRDEMSNFSYLSLFDQSHPGCFSRYVESFIRGVMGFVVRFLACGRSCHNKESHFFPFHLICLTESSAKADRGALSMAKSDHETHHPLMELSIQREASQATRMTLV